MAYDEYTGKNIAGKVQCTVGGGAMGVVHDKKTCP